MRRLLQLVLFALLLSPCASTTSIIQGWYAYYNAQYFEAKLPVDVRVEVFYAGRDRNGIRSMGVTFACDSPSRLCIFIDPEFNPEMRGRKFTLLHEMAHVKIGIHTPDGLDSHGPLFQAEMHRLANEGAFEDIW